MSLKSFDPNVYGRTEDFQKESLLSDHDWIERFVACIKRIGEHCADESFKPELDTYAREIAPTYLEDREEYVTPEEAAETDVSYWESEE